MKSHPLCGSQPVRLLVLESATDSGGSVSALRNLVLHLDPGKIEPLIALYSTNTSRALQELKAAGFPVAFLSRFRVGFPSGGKLARALGDGPALLQETFKAARLVWYFCAALLPLIVKVSYLIWSKSIDIVLLNQDIHYHIAGVLAARFAGVPIVCRKAGGIG